MTNLSFPSPFPSSHFHPIHVCTCYAWWPRSVRVFDLLKRLRENRYTIQLLPLFQNESWCWTFHINPSLICMRKNLKGEWFWAKTRFDTEAKTTRKLHIQCPFILTSFRFLGSFEIQVKAYLISTHRTLENLTNWINSMNKLFTKEQTDLNTYMSKFMNTV